MNTFPFARTGRTMAIAAAILALGIAAADARPGGGSSFGSRGGRTYSAPPVTNTAPRTAAPMERSITQPSQVQPGMAAQRPGMAQPSTGWRPGFGTGFMGGLLGAGLLGMLFGHGFMGGFGGLSSLFGLLLQAGLIVGGIYLVMRLIRGRQPAFAGGSGATSPLAANAGPGGPLRRDAMGGAGGSGLGGSGLGGSGLGGSALGGMGLGAGAGAAMASAKPSDAVGIEAKDFDAFEASLKAVNAAWDREDLTAMRGLATPEMVGYFGEELARNAGRGLHDRVSNVTLEQGDLAEAWREGSTDYATVAMRFSLVNALTERATGKVVEGDATKPQEATELWTFRRDAGGSWMLSAIQQS
ncbi:TIM44-like domain-containing protein [uncultured Alsobacter sp.]|uniref:Tim44 domain-containing protein n=1 Tax=uncultured Alsobacter sp. TaxID=1748258 RepID=UPI0025EA11FE|nr:TIM44-like domain-containing protein [uncultured Alsobacter sp.]